MSRTPVAPEPHPVRVPKSMIESYRCTPVLDRVQVRLTRRAIQDNRARATVRYSSGAGHDTNASSPPRGKTSGGPHSGWLSEFPIDRGATVLDRGDNDGPGVQGHETSLRSDMAPRSTHRRIALSSRQTPTGGHPTGGLRVVRPAPRACGVAVRMNLGLLGGS